MVMRVVRTKGLRETKYICQFNDIKKQFKILKKNKSTFKFEKSM